jgi:hypothetical protein
MFLSLHARHKRHLPEGPPQYNKQERLLNRAQSPHDRPAYRLPRVPSKMSQLVLSQGPLQSHDRQKKTEPLAPVPGKNTKDARAFTSLAWISSAQQKTTAINDAAVPIESSM